MRFWDASAIVPLIVPEPSTPLALALRDADPGLLVWAWTPVECLSALTRLGRENRLRPRELNEASTRLSGLRAAWSEYADFDAVRARAERCLRLHPLRAADAGQLATALLLAEHLRVPLPFVTFDERLADAAIREGFDVLGAGPD
jgi:predicted nucleic acid-binding protein